MLHLQRDGVRHVHAHETSDGFACLWRKGERVGGGGEGVDGGGVTCVQVRKPWLRTSSSQQPLCSNAMAPKLTVSVTSVKQQLLLPCKQTVSVWQTERV